MKVYAVFKTAVYRHECGGVFSTFEAAEAAAERCIAGERDDHHDYEVVAFELDAMTPQTPLVKLPGLHGSTYTAGGDLEEDEALCTWSRTKGVVRKTPNVGAEPTVEAGAAWPRRDDDNGGPERPGGACRSGSARASC